MQYLRGTRYLGSFFASPCGPPSPFGLRRAGVWGGWQDCFGPSTALAMTNKKTQAMLGLYKRENELRFFG